MKDRLLNNALEVVDLVKHFGTVAAVQGVSFSVPAGMTVSLLGPSGCGKTTILRCVAGLERPDSGAIRLGASDVTRLPANQRDLAMVFQEGSLYPHMSVADNIGYTMKVHGVGQQQRYQRVKETAGLLGIMTLLDRYPYQLSGGEAQRVALAKALAASTSLLLLDEPFSGVDIQRRVALRREIGPLLKRFRRTTILVTHDQDEALSMGDQIIVMNAGEVVQRGSSEDLLTRPCNAFVAGFCGTPSMNLITLEREDPTDHFVAPGINVDTSRFPADAMHSVGSAASVLLGIRPQSVCEGHSYGSVRLGIGEIELVERYGAEDLVQVRLGTTSIHLLARQEDRHRLGEEIEVGFDPRHSLIFSVDGNRPLLWPGGNS